MSDQDISHPIISLRAIHKQFGVSPNEVTAIGGVDFEVAKGEFVSIIGPSGCGKSTILRLVADLLEPTSGELLISGGLVGDARKAREIGMVFQSPVLYDWRTIRKNIELPLEVMGMERRLRRERADAMLELVGLTEFAEKSPWQLSGGMQQRVAIARALSFNPTILLMDEPFGALDEMTREHMNTELQRIWMDTQTTILFITHSIPEAVFLSDRVLVMSPRPGTIVAEHEISLGRPRNSQTRGDEDFFHLVTEVRDHLEL